jgi:uroporphyrinogen III methyltransferase / synthase
MTLSTERDMAHSKGKVHILGAGPGSALFLTVSGRDLLLTADVVIYDALIDSDLLRLTSKTCIHINVGKRGQEPSAAQADINRLLVSHCQQGQQVVRLKSGDPAVFGRIAAEVKALRAAQCEVTVWPGLSSALAVPLLSGIPLTDPVLSRSVTIVSAHDLEALDWEFLSCSESLVVLMGGRALSALVERLQQHGKPAETTIAVIRWGGWAQQQVWTATLGTIVNRVGQEHLSPSVMVIGAVVTLRQTLGLLNFPEGFLDVSVPAGDSTEDSAGAKTDSTPQPLPLTGRTVLITRSIAQASDFRRGLEAQGSTVLEMAALEVVPPSSWEPLDRAIAELPTFDWIILTSANGVQYCMERLFAQGKDARALAGVKIAVVGRKTAVSLKQWGLIPDFMPPNYIADDLINHFPVQQLSGLRCLFPRVESGGREVLVQELTLQGVDVVEVPAYQSQCPDQAEPAILEAITAKKIDVITFASSKTVNYFWEILLRSSGLQASLVDWQEAVRNVKIASIGPQTSQTCRQRFGRVDIEAQEYTLEGLTQAIVEAYTTL